jgi:hypothetical protein
MKQQYVNEISHRRFCRMGKNYVSTVRGQVLGTARFTAIKSFPETVFSSDHKNNLNWVILGTKCACLLPRKYFLY